MRCCCSFSAGSVSPRLRMRRLTELYGLAQVSCSCYSRLLHIPLWADQQLGSSWPGSSVLRDRNLASDCPGRNLASAGLVLLPYGVWSLLHFDEWRSQFLDTMFLSTIVKPGSGTQGSLHGSFLSTQVGNVAELVKYAPAIVAVILLGLAVFPWRMSPDAAGALIGASAVAAASTESYMKFLFLISLVLAAAGIILLSTKVGKSYRQLDSRACPARIAEWTRFPSTSRL